MSKQFEVTIKFKLSEELDEVQSVEEAKERVKETMDGHYDWPEKFEIAVTESES